MYGDFSRYVEKTYIVMLSYVALCSAMLKRPLVSNILNTYIPTTNAGISPEARPENRQITPYYDGGMAVS